MRDAAELTQAIETYADMVRRICFVYLKNKWECEDVFQDVFLKYALSSDTFQSKEHEKAWLIRVCLNQCKDVFKSFFRKNSCPLEEALPVLADVQNQNLDLLGAIADLPEKYRVVIYLFYYEGYTALEIAHMLHKKENTIYTHLARARQSLKERLGGDFLEEF